MSQDNFQKKLATRLLAAEEGQDQSKRMEEAVIEIDNQISPAQKASPADTKVNMGDTDPEIPVAQTTEEIQKLNEELKKLYGTSLQISYGSEAQPIENAPAISIVEPATPVAVRAKTPTEPAPATTREELEEQQMLKDMGGENIFLKPENAAKPEIPLAIIIQDVPLNDPRHQNTAEKKEPEQWKGEDNLRKSERRKAEKAVVREEKEKARQIMWKRLSLVGKSRVIGDRGIGRPEKGKDPETTPEAQWLTNAKVADFTDTARKEFEEYFRERLSSSELSEDVFCQQVVAGMHLDDIDEPRWGKFGIGPKYTIEVDGQGVREFKNEAEFQRFVKFEAPERAKSELEKEINKRVDAAVEAKKEELSERNRNKKADKATGKKGEEELASDQAIEAQGREEFSPKEVLGKPTEKEYEKLREEGIEPILKGSFSGEDLILDSASQQKTEKTRESEVWEIIKRQEEALVECEVFIDKEINVDADISQDVLKAWVDKFSGDYDFNTKQIQFLQKRIDSYLEKRKDFKTFYERYEQGDISKIVLIKELTGKKLNNKEADRIEVSGSAISVILKTDQETLKLLKKEDDTAMEKDIGGFAQRNKDSINYVVVESSASIKERIEEQRRAAGKGPLNAKQLEFIENYPDKVILHELQHQEFDLKNEDKKQELIDNATASRKEYRQEKNLTEKQNKLTVYLEAEQKRVLDKVKNEVLSCLHNEGLDGLEKKLESKFLKGKESRYDYFKKIRTEKSFKIIEQGNLAMVEKIFVEDYQSIIKKSVAALSILANKDGGYSIERAITFLTKQDFESWPENILLLTGVGSQEPLEKNEAEADRSDGEKLDVKPNKPKPAITKKRPGGGEDGNPKTPETVPQPQRERLASDVEKRAMEERERTIEKKLGDLKEKIIKENISENQGEGAMFKIEVLETGFGGIHNIISAREFKYSDKEEVTLTAIEREIVELNDYLENVAIPLRVFEEKLHALAPDIVVSEKVFIKLKKEYDDASFAVSGRWFGGWLTRKRISVKKISGTTPEIFSIEEFTKKIEEYNT